MHGSGGAGPREEFWSKTFNEMGIASFLVDSFSGRGLTSVSANQAMLGRFNMILDAYRAHANFRRTRGSIAPVSLSWGSRAAARTALYASLKRFHQAWDPEVAFAAYIPLYASCNPTLIGDTDVSGVPIRMFHGAADDYVPVAPCRAYVERLRAVGKDVQLTEFADRTTPTTIRSVARHRSSPPMRRACVPASSRRRRPASSSTPKPGSPSAIRTPASRSSPHRLQRGGRSGDQAAVKDLLRTVFKLN